MRGYTIGKNVSIIDYRVERKGYGRQAVYVSLKDNETGEKIEGSFYVRDVFPNIEEHYMRRYRLRDDESLVFDDDSKIYVCSNTGSEYTEEEVFDNIVDLLNEAFKGEEING